MSLGWAVLGCYLWLLGCVLLLLVALCRACRDEDFPCDE